MDGITDSMDMILSKLREMVKDREAWHVATEKPGMLLFMGLQRDGCNLVTEQQQDLMN